MASIGLAISIAECSNEEIKIICVLGFALVISIAYLFTIKNT